MTAHVQKMQMLTDCGRGISGMASNHIKTNITWVVMCGRMVCKPILNLGLQKQCGSMPTPCLDKAVLAQEGGGYHRKVLGNS